MSRIWKGNFSSTQYGSYVKGSIDIELPHPLVLDNPLQLRAAIQYTGIYRNSARTVLSLHTEGIQGKSSQIMIVFKGAIQEQAIQFTCNEITDTQINGTYETQNPADFGLFTVQITDTSVFDPTERLGVGCIII